MSETEELKIDVLADLIDAKKKVRDLLNNDERCRNDDLYLMLRFWESKEHIKVLVSPDQIGGMTAAETISRVRREIQNKDKEFLPTNPDVIIERRIRQEVIHDYYAGSNPKLVEAVILKRFAVK